VCTEHQQTETTPVVAWEQPPTLSQELREIFRSLRNGKAAALNH
jgi:hypothetical protein